MTEQGKIRQTLTEGGSLYGYTVAELEPHITEYHGRSLSWLRTEGEYLAAHGLGCYHEHYRTETGALALIVKRPTS